MTKKHDTVVFIPAWNEEENLPAVLAELRPSCPTRTCSSSTTARPTAPPQVAREGGAEVLSFGENRGLPRPSRPGYG